MEWRHFIVLFGLIPCVICSTDDCTVGYILCGITIFLMSIAIVGLSLALHMVKNNKALFGISIARNSSYVRQESGIGATLCNVTSSNTINDQCRNDGSTLTVNSGIVEIRGVNEPETPTRLEEPKIAFKKPLGPTIPIIQKAQMDKIIEDYLNRRQKSDSTTLRELDALAKPNINGLHSRRNSSLNDLNTAVNEEVDESLYGNALTINYINKTKDPPKKPSPKVPKKKPTKMKETEVEEQEVYDTLPNPIRCSDDGDDDVDNIPVYDMPPRRSWEVNENRSVVMDQDTQYLLPLSKRECTDEEKTCYVNAKQRP